ncbi:MAG: agmatinase [Rhodospirillales bacterium]|nr:agmatinase [Rhodospirillales bacterium]
MTDQDGDRAFRTTATRGRWPEMTYGGALSFLRRRYTRDLEGVDVVVSGIPYDSAVTYRSGARLGPRAIRAASVQLAELKAFPFGFDLFAHLAVIDYGDCFLDPHHPETIPEAIETHAAAIVASGARMLTFGGDHYISYPLIKGHAKQYGPVALLHVDAHSDTWEDDGKRFDHGSMFARALAEGLIDVEHSTQVGIRTFNDSDQGFEILTAPWIHRNGIEAALEVVRARAGRAPLYLTFDIDALDPAFAPGTGTPVAGGLSTWQALELIRGLAGLNLIAMDLVEVAPSFDHAEMTAIAAATLAHDWLGLLAEEKGAKRRAVGRL